MRLLEYYNLGLEDKRKQDGKALLELEEASKELDKKGKWYLPDDLKKRLKKGEEIRIWCSKGVC
jgi:hypothetical protein